MSATARGPDSSPQDVWTILVCGLSGGVASGLGGGVGSGCGIEVGPVSITEVHLKKKPLSSPVVW